MKAIDLGFAFAVLAFSASCGGEAEAAERIPRPVRACRVAELTIRESVEAFGSLSFRAKLDLCSGQDGTMVTIFVREGDWVEKGQVLAIVDNPQLELAVARAENGVADARAGVDLAGACLNEGRLSFEGRVLGLERASMELEQGYRELAEAERKHADQEALYARGGLSEESILEARFSLASARERVSSMERELEAKRVGLRGDDLSAAGLFVPGDAEGRLVALRELSVAGLKAELARALAALAAAETELKSARVARSELSVRSPIRGVVGARYLQEGERVRRDDKIFTLMDVEALLLVASVREEEAAKLERGMEASVTVDSAPRTLVGMVDSVSPVADSRTASFTVKLLLSQGLDGLKPGMFARASIFTGRQSKLTVVPESAIASKDGDSARVFVLSGSVVRSCSVRLGNSVPEGRAVEDGLSPGEVVVDWPDPELKEGERVELSEEA